MRAARAATARRRCSGSSAASAGASRSARCRGCSKWSAAYPQAPGADLDPDAPPLPVVTGAGRADLRLGRPGAPRRAARRPRPPGRPRPRPRPDARPARLAARHRRGEPRPRSRASSTTPVDLRRFRTNLHLRLDAEAFAEERWEGRRVRVGDAELVLLHPCERCAIPTRDPDTTRSGPSSCAGSRASTTRCSASTPVPSRPRPCASATRSRSPEAVSRAGGDPRRLACGGSAPARHADRPAARPRGAGPPRPLRAGEQVREQQHPDHGPQARGELRVARARPQQHDQHQNGTLPPSSQAARSSSFALRDLPRRAHHARVAVAVPHDDPARRRWFMT